MPWIPSRLTPVMLAFFDQHLPDITSLFVTQNHPIESREPTTFIQLDGKILTGKPDQFDGKLTIPLIFRLRFSQQNQSIETWNNGGESVELILDIVDSRGIFASCYALVTPALGAAALQGLLEAVQQHRGKRSEMLQRFSQEFCQKVGKICGTSMENLGKI